MLGIHGHPQMTNLHTLLQYYNHLAQQLTYSTEISSFSNSRLVVVHSHASQWVAE